MSLRVLCLNPIFKILLYWLFFNLLRIGVHVHVSELDGVVSYCMDGVGVGPHEGVELPVSSGRSGSSSAWTSVLAELEVSEEVDQPSPPPHVPVTDRAGITDEERRRWTELQASPTYRSVERNRVTCEHKVQLILDKAREVLTSRGIQLRDPEDVNLGLDIYLEDIWEREPGARLRALTAILKADPTTSRAWSKIIESIQKLNEF